MLDELSSYLSLGFVALVLFCGCWERLGGFLTTLIFAVILFSVLYRKKKKEDQAKAEERQKEQQKQQVAAHKAQIRQNIIHSLSLSLPSDYNFQQCVAIINSVVQLLDCKGAAKWDIDSAQIQICAPAPTRTNEDLLVKLTIRCCPSLFPWLNKMISENHHQAACRTLLSDGLPKDWADAFIDLKFSPSPEDTDYIFRVHQLMLPLEMHRASQTGEYEAAFNAFEQTLLSHLPHFTKASSGSSYCYKNVHLFISNHNRFIF